MEYRLLGRSGLKVSVLSMGTMTFGGAAHFGTIGATGVAEAQRQIDLCLDAGVNLIDTANGYSFGASEEILGAALEGGRRDRTLICTKARYPIGDGPNDGGLSRQHLIAECEKSLKRLRTDHIDVYLMHHWDGLTPVEETLETLDTLVKSGKVRYVGCSNYSAWHLMKSLAASERERFQRYVCMQIHYSLEAREAEYELVPIALDQGIGIMVWAPLAGGLLSGKYRRGVLPDSGRHVDDWGEPPIRDEDRLYDIVDVLVEIAEERGVTAANVALAWELAKPAITTLVVGVRTEAQMADNLAAVDLQLTEEELARLDSVSAIPLIYPYWHQARNASDRLGPIDTPLLGPYVHGDTQRQYGGPW